MAYWLFKQEPSDYSYDDLERDGEAVWDGVTNALAQKHLRSCQSGDKVFFYHTGDEKAVVGIMTIAEGPAQVDAKNVVVKVKPQKKLKQPVPLANIKLEESLAQWELVRISRLSVMPVTPEIWKTVLAMSKAK